MNVAGYTDRLGSEAYNMDLSQRRADRVKARLAEKGVDAQISAVGYGEAHQVKACSNEKGNQLISCLRPNRRVEISSSGSALKEEKTTGGQMGPAPLYQK